MQHTSSVVRKGSGSPRRGHDPDSGVEWTSNVSRLSPRSDRKSSGKTQVGQEHAGCEEFKDKKQEEKWL